MLYFQKIRWKNLLSTGNDFTEIDFTRSPTTLVIGENGGGKSTLIDALCLVLFNKPFRKVNRAQLVNSVNKKDCEIQVEFVNGPHTYWIVRGIKPNKFEIYCDGELVNQDAKAKDYQKYLEDVILKLNFTSFTQIDILGSSSFVPFMRLPATQRREVIEDILDLNVVSVMNSLLKEKVSKTKSKLDEINNELKIENEKITIHQEYIDEMEGKKKLELEEKDRQIKELTAKKTEYESMAVEIKSIIDGLSLVIEKEDSLKSKLKKMNKFEMEIDSKIRSYKENIRFFQEHENCPTCSQNIDAEIKSDKLRFFQEKLDKNIDGLGQLEIELKRLEHDVSVVDAAKESFDQQKQYLSETDSEINDLQRQIDSIKNVTFDNNDIDTKKQLLSDIENNKKTLDKNKEGLVYLLSVYDICLGMLKDTGIKTQIVKQYNPIINQYVNKYLNDLDFFVNFELDDNFNEKILSRYRDDFSYESFSEGEKSRIDLAIMFTWRAIAKMRNKTNTNILILDEVFDASLDSSGCDEFLKMINELSDITNVFVISHKGDILQDKFRNVIKFVKNKNFSEIQKGE